VQRTPSGKTLTGLYSASAPRLPKFNQSLGDDYDAVVSSPLSDSKQPPSPQTRFGMVAMAAAKAQSPLKGNYNDDFDLNMMKHSRSLTELRTSNAREEAGALSGTDLSKSESQVTLRMLRQLQGEVAQLKRNLDHLEEERKEWSLRYSKRLCISSNLLLGVWLFATRFTKSLSRRHRMSGLAAQLLIPPTSQTNNSLGLYVTSAIFAGLKASAMFFFALFLLTRNRQDEWLRVIGFLLSSGYSVYLGVVIKFLPRMNYLNVLFNLAYIIARYYHLQGIPAFNQLQFL
jgi:hypothetical protein